MKGFHSGDGNWLSLPKSFSKEKIPVDPSEIPTVESVKLGWCVVGPNWSNTLSCCLVSSNSHGNSNHLVVEETQIKDSGSETMLKKLFDIDSVPETKISTEFESFSRDDLHFLKIVENESEFIDGHYHVPLPFRNKNISFPDNFFLALKD